MRQIARQSPDAATLAAWCREATRGDAAALERLLWTHHARLLGFIRRKVGVDWRAKIDPEDVLQEAYIEVFAAIGSFVYQGEDSFYHWVTRIIDHRFIDHVRRWRRKKRDVAREVSPAAMRTSSFDGLLERCYRDAQTPSVALRREDAVNALMACIAQLPDHYRAVVQRVYLDQEALAAVAADLGRSQDAVRRLGSRAVERLNRCLGRASRYLSTHG